MADTYTVERSTAIAAPASDIYARIVDLHRWSSWSPWEELDPDMERSYSGADEGIGAVYEWSGNMKAGTGRIEIVSVVPDERVELELRFLKPFKSESQVSFAIEGSGDAKTVTWTMTGGLTLLTKLIRLVRPMDKMVGPDFERGLAGLKAETERAT